jgi:hypothetical protein
MQNTSVKEIINALMKTNDFQCFHDVNEAYNSQYCYDCPLWILTGSAHIDQFYRFCSKKKSYESDE